MFGILMGIVKNMVFVGYSIIEALVFMIAYNNLAPFINDNLICLPVANIEYWNCVSMFILIHFIGRFIGKISPLRINLKNETEVKD